MPPTNVHVALGSLVAAGLLGAAFDRRSLAVVALAAGAPDLDALASPVLESAHGALFHTLLIPGFAAALLYYDVRVKRGSVVRERYGPRGVRVAWIAVLSYALAGIGLDLFNISAANALYPLVDQFYAVVGRIEVTTTKGFVQTFVRIDPSGTGAPLSVRTRGSTAEYFVGTWLDPTRGSDPERVDRTFHLAEGGWQLLIVAAGALVAGSRLAGTGVGVSARHGPGAATPDGGPGRGGEE